MKKSDILTEVESLKQKAKAPAPKADEVLTALLKQVEKVNFFEIAFPEFLKAENRIKAINDSCVNEAGAIDSQKLKPFSDELEALRKKIENKPKVTQKHYKIICIEELIKLANKHHWGLCQRQGYYYAYNGQFWIPLEQNDLKRFLGNVALKMGVPKFDSKDSDFKDKLFKQFESEGYLSEPTIDRNTILINLQNGTFEITPKGNKLREFREKDFLTYQLQFQYDPKAKAPKFEKYLNEVLPDAESRTVLAEFMGYVFTRNMKLEKILFLYGTGHNGKSVLFDTISGLMGTENISYYSLKSITDDQGYYRASLVNKLINWASDIGDRLKSEKFKQLASGEPTEARLPYKDPFIIKNVCKFAFNTNVLPTDVEHTKGFFRRFLIIPFDQYIEPGKADPKLADKIISDELPGVFNWILEGLQRLIKQGNFSRCKKSDQALAQYQLESDSVLSYMDESGYKPDIEQWIQAKPIYEQYRQYCFDEGLRPVARKNFHSRLEAKGYQFGKRNVGKVIFAIRTVNTDEHEF